MRNVTNKVLVEGYLKENNLELTRNDKGDEIIRGTLVVAVDDAKSYRAQFYVNKYKAAKDDGPREENKTYTKMLDMLPTATFSIAGILRDSASMTFDQAKESVTKVWFTGALQEYLRKDEKGEVISSVTIKGLNAGVKTISDRHPFDPRATFETEIYIEKKSKEMKDGEETGRIILTGLIPEYDDMVSRIDFVTGDQNSTDYIDENYEVGQTVKILGDLVNSFTRIEKASSNASFGRAAAPQYETTFVNERQIFGGNPTPWEADDEMGLKPAEIKKALVNREQKIEALPTKSESAAPKTTRGFDSAPAAPKKNFAFNRSGF